MKNLAEKITAQNYENYSVLQLSRTKFFKIPFSYAHSTKSVATFSVFAISLAKDTGPV